jgi:phenylalanyl-tRNA synthetase alpha chain
MEEQIRQQLEEALREIEQAKDNDQLNLLRVKYIGRKGFLSQALEAIKTVEPEKRPLIGKLTNEFKQKVTQALSRRQESILKLTEDSQERIDVTLPGVRHRLGHKHPLTKTMDDILEVFTRIGFEIVEGPEIETDWHNFEALNIPKSHPSRDTFDTFYVDQNLLLRSQTSTVQIRVMEKRKPPLRIVTAGKVYRPDAVDASHSFMFHQIEGFMVDKTVSFAELKGALSCFISGLFGPKTKVRFRPHYFPFTEPSAEVDISCIICGGKGCRVCGQKGWLEVLGAGMINPAVFKAVGYPSGRYTGFAFGMGIERIAMLRYGINDIRLFFENDVRFLRQF